MNELSFALLLLSALLLLAVLLHGQWRVWRSTPRRAVASAAAKAASPQSRRDPVFDEAEAAHQPPEGTAVLTPQQDAAVRLSANAQGERQKAGQMSAAPSTEVVFFDDTDLPHPTRAMAGLDSLAQAPLAYAALGLDVLIDSIAHISVEPAQSGAAAAAALPSTRRLGSKAFAIEGLNTKTREWQRVLPTERYSAFQAGVQLANRSGALNDIEFSEFVQRTQVFADALGGEVDFPDMRTEVLRARELDQFASLHDARLSFCLKAIKTAWSAGYVQQHAGNLGFVLGAVPGRMVLPTTDAGAPPALVLSFDPQAALSEDPNQSALLEIKLALEVAQVPSSLKPFGLLCGTIQQLAAHMQGRVCDEQGQAVEPASLAGIAQDLERLYARMAERDLSAGSSQARRLFS
jgi:hypothetical protein